MVSKKTVAIMAIAVAIMTATVVNLWMPCWLTYTSWYATVDEQLISANNAVELEVDWQKSAISSSNHVMESLDWTSDTNGTDLCKYLIHRTEVAFDIYVQSADQEIVKLSSHVAELARVRATEGLQYRAQILSREDMEWNFERSWEARTRRMALYHEAMDEWQTAVHLCSPFLSRRERRRRYAWLE